MKGLKYIMNESNKIVDINKTERLSASSEIYSDEDLCAKIPTMPTNPQYAFAYVKFQNTVDLLSPENALCAGTVFAELNFPYCGWKKSMKQ